MLNDVAMRMVMGALVSAGRPLMPSELNKGYNFADLDTGFPEGFPPNLRQIANLEMGMETGVKTGHLEWHRDPVSAIKVIRLTALGVAMAVGE